MVLDPLTIVMLVVLALVVLFIFRNSRKRQKDMAALQEKMVPGAEVMTNFGMYGTIISVDTAENQAMVETTPGTVLRVHRQTIARVIEAKEPAVESIPEVSASDTQSETAADVSEPQYGERIVENDANASVEAAGKKD